MTVPAFLLLMFIICFINSCKLTTVYFDNGSTYDFEEDGLGSYSYTVHLPDQSRYERGMMGKNGYEVHGEYSFSYEGKTYRTSYVADVNGYRTRTHFTGNTVPHSTYPPKIPIQEEDGDEESTAIKKEEKYDSYAVPQEEGYLTPKIPIQEEDGDEESTAIKKEEGYDSYAVPQEEEYFTPEIPIQEEGRDEESVAIKKEYDSYTVPQEQEEEYLTPEIPIQEEDGDEESTAIKKEEGYDSYAVPQEETPTLVITEEPQSLNKHVLETIGGSRGGK